MNRVVVIGGGVTGLVAARALAQGGATVVLVEPDQLGGKLQRSAFDGRLLDETADNFLARVPEGVALCRELGLEGELVSPAVRRAHVWSRGALRLLPEAQLLGVPTDLEELAASGIVSPQGVERARADLHTPLVAPTADVTIGALMRDRLGDEVLERLIDPLVGGINAGDTDHLSLAAVVPQLDAAVRSGAPSLIEACRRQRAAVADPSAPVFFAPRGGMGALAEALVDDLARLGVEVIRARAVGLEREPAHWRVALAGHRALPADGVLVATPAGPAGTLIGPHAPGAGSVLSAIPYASVAMVSLAVPRAGIDRELDGSGYLVPKVEGRTITACSWTSAKWPHLSDPETAWLRVSVGRDGDTAVLGWDDDALVAAVLADLADTMALRGAPTDVRVRRWTGSLPQYRPGHLDRIAAVEEELAARAPRLVVAGAALRGLGVPACIRQGTEGATQLLDALQGDVTVLPPSAATP